jgi:hypothetical protein
MSLQSRLTKLEISIRANGTRHLGNFSLLFQDWMRAMAANDTAEAQRLRGKLTRWSANP